MNVSEFLAYLWQRKGPGQAVAFTILRKGKNLAITYVFDQNLPP